MKSITVESEILELFARLHALGVSPSQAAEGVRTAQTLPRFKVHDVARHKDGYDVVVVDTDYDNYHDPGRPVQVRRLRDLNRPPVWEKHEDLTAQNRTL